MTATEKAEAIPLPLAAEMLGYTDRTLAGLIRDGKLQSVKSEPPYKGRGRPPIMVLRSSLLEYAEGKRRVLRELTAAELRGRNNGLSEWLAEQPRLLKRLREAGIYEIDGTGARGKVWVRFRPPLSRGQSQLASFWRRDEGGIFGSRKFSVEFGRKDVDVFGRSQDEEGDRADLMRCLQAALTAVRREEGRLDKERRRRRVKGMAAKPNLK